MPPNVKNLIVVLAISAVVFKFAKSTALLFSSEKDFSRRRNLWYVLTAAAFLSPSIWLYVLIAVPLLVGSGREGLEPFGFVLVFATCCATSCYADPAPGRREAARRE